MPGIHGMQQQLPTATITIAPNTTNQNLPDSVFIATAGLTQGILIGKHKVLVVVQHLSSRRKSEMDQKMRMRSVLLLTWSRAH